MKGMGPRGHPPALEQSTAESQEPRVAWLGMGRIRTFLPARPFQAAERKGGTRLLWGIPLGSPLCHWEPWSNFPHFSESGESEAHWGTTGGAECLGPLLGLRGLLAPGFSMPLRCTPLL